MNPGHGKKHRLPGIEPQPKKRVRLELMLSGLSLDEPKPDSPVYINPLAIPEPSNKKQKTDIDSIISGKIYEAYKQDLLRGLQVIRYIHPVAMIAWRFQTWVKRLFNRFIRKFNRNNSNVHPMKTFRDYSRIMALVDDPKVRFTLGELLHIVSQESVLEKNAIERRREKTADSSRLEEIKEQEDAVKECNYQYWDRLRTRSVDVEMASDDSVDADVDMDEPVEANYGTYYSQY